MSGGRVDSKAYGSRETYTLWYSNLYSILRLGAFPRFQGMRAGG